MLTKIVRVKECCVYGINLHINLWRNNNENNYANHKKFSHESSANN